MAFPDLTTIKRILFLLLATLAGFFGFRAIANSAKAKAEGAMKESLDLEAEANALHEQAKKLAREEISLDEYQKHVDRVKELMK